MSITNGGLVQISNYGNTDLMLTNNPEISFFKAVYRRYTNFGKIFVENQFDNGINFDNTSVINIPKSYDLLGNLILKIKMPKLDVSSINKLYNSLNTELLDKMIEYYEIFYEFKEQLRNIITIFFENIDSNSTTYIEDLNIFIRDYITDEQIEQYYFIVDYFFKFTKIKNNSYYKNSCLYKTSDIIYIYNNLTYDFYTLEQFEGLIFENVAIMDELNKIMYDLINDNLKTPKVKISWIDKIGIYLFDYFDLSIAGNPITTLYSNYVDVYGNINYTNKNVYENMINIRTDVPFYATSDSIDYVYLQVPFWFVRNYGLALPLIALQFNSIQFKLKTKKAIELLNIELPTNVDVSQLIVIKSLINQIILNQLSTIITEDLFISILFEYISLDKNERQKFAQSGHEYLITQVQNATFTNSSNSNSNNVLNFYYCCKDLLWIATQSNDYDKLFGKKYYGKYFYIEEPNLSNTDLYYLNYINYLYKNDYIINNTYSFLNGLYTYLELVTTENLTMDNYINDIMTLCNYILTTKPYIKSSGIYFNSTKLINQETNYFTYVQSYSYYNSTPLVGTNLYSFSLYPCDTQPSGSANLGRIPYVSINNTFNNNNIVIDNTSSINYNVINQYDLNIYCENYNVIRFIGGICGLAFQYS